MTGMSGDLGLVRARLDRLGHPLHLGARAGVPVFARPEHAVLVLGPPRSGKTSSLVVPNVLAAPGSVVSTSTKPDVLAATAAERRRLGQCWLFDPSGTVTPPRGVEPARWSPLSACGRWEDALLTVRAMVGAGSRRETPESFHWTERAEALLTPLFHAAALDGFTMADVMGWINRRDLNPALAVLHRHGAAVPADVLIGMAATDRRELSGIWSTASGVLAAYRSEAAVASARGPNIEPAALSQGADTVYICAGARHQALVAPVVVAFVEQVRAGAYAAAAGRVLGDGRSAPSVTLALDEVANIAPLPDLPAMVSEGGSQGLRIMACLQDLSQARRRWGQQADGFLSLFGAKVVLPGIGDLRTLELVSRLAGDTDVAVRTAGRQWGPGGPQASVSWTTRRQPRLPVDEVAGLPPGTALVIEAAHRPALVALTPWWSTPPFSRCRRGGAAPPSGLGLDRR
jgi:type IV secretory pathway TraG/TraD family ATPase VirD4